MGVLISFDGFHHVHGAAPYPSLRGGGVLTPPGHRYIPTWGVDSGHSQWYVVRGVVEPLGWPWLLW